MEPGKGGRVSLVVFDQAAATCGPGKGSFDNPPSGEKHEAALRLWEFNNFKPDPFVGGGLRRPVAGLT
jgi:hypothetical protein